MSEPNPDGRDKEPADTTIQVKCSRCDKPAEWIFGERDSFCQEHWNAVYHNKGLQREKVSTPH